MIRRGCGINVIIEGLEVNRQGLITESAEEQVQKDIKKLLDDASVSNKDKKRLYNVLTSLYSLCNDTGPYKLIKGEFEHIKGGSDDFENPEAPHIDPTLYSYKYIIRFLSAIDVRDLYKSIYKVFKDCKPNYETIDIDSFAITVCFSGGDDSGLYLSIEREARGIKVEVGYQSYVIEAKTGAFGHEIGLPIDRDNCESTGIGGISTPTGTFSSDNDKEEIEKKKKKLIPVVNEAEDEEGSSEEEEEPSKESDTKEEKDKNKDVDMSTPLSDIERLTCPKCKSPNVNSDGEVLMCSDCTYTWDLKKEVEVQKDNMLPQEDDVSVSDFQKGKNQDNESNDVECLETQQNVDRSNGIE